MNRNHVHDDTADHPLARMLADSPAPPATDGLPDALVAYRHSRTFRRAHRRATSLATAVLAATTVTLGGSVAAAYAASLPRPVQRVAHHLFTHLGVPAPDHDRAPARPARPADSAGRLRPRHVFLPTPTATPTHRTVAATAPVVVLTAPSQVLYGDSAAVVALVRDAPPGTVVDVVAHATHGSWSTLLEKRTNAHHLAVFRLPMTGDVRVEAAHGKSAAVVHMVPRLHVTSATSAHGWSVAVRGEGVSAGERVDLVRRSGGHDVVVGSARFGRDGQARIVLRGSRQASSYAVTVASTARHAATTVPVAKSSSP